MPLLKRIYSRINDCRSLNVPDAWLIKGFLFLFKTALFFLTLNIFFLVYAGLQSHGGKLYLPFLSEHADFIGVFRRFLLWGGAQFATLMGYPAGYNNYTLFVHGGSFVQMVYSCLGFNLMSAYAALVLAWPAKVLYRVRSLIVGIVVIIVLNMVRLGGLAVLYTTGNTSLFKQINHHDLFNILMLVIVLIMFIIHMNHTERKQPDN